MANSYTQKRGRISKNFNIIITKILWKLRKGKVPLNIFIMFLLYMLTIISPSLPEEAEPFSRSTHLYRY